MSNDPSTMNPIFKFSLSPDEPALTPESELWSAPLPDTRHAFSHSGGGDGSGHAMTYGDYFTAVEHFLCGDNCSVLRDAVLHLTDNPAAPAEIRDVSVFLVKFGAFYHPSYVLVGGHLPFVLNVAASTVGRKMIAQEYQNLSRLDTEFKTSYWPKVFGIGQGEDSKGRRIPMFLGQWFDGYYEFHLTGEDPGRRNVVAWDTLKGHRVLSKDQASACMEQAAFILTHAYNPLTFETIGHWHHAAGDFVIALDDDEVALRLITVRNYAPMIENPQPDVTTILDALLVFLVRISMQLRLDRLDGIGRVACYGDDVVPAIWRGFFRGLHAIAPLHGLPDDFDTTVKEYVVLHSTEQLKSMAVSVIEKTPFSADEQDLLRRILDDHISTFISAFSI